MKVDYVKLGKQALEIKENSYSPYSNFKVGCALQAKSGKVYLGVNVENAVYRSTCAEITALNTAITQGEREFIALAVCGGDGNSFVLPCGNCRQILYEFNPNLEIISITNDHSTQVKLLKDLLPHAFDLK